MRRSVRRQEISTDGFLGDTLGLALFRHDVCVRAGDLEIYFHRGELAHYRVDVSDSPAQRQGPRSES